MADLFTTADLGALAFFLAAWIGFGWLVGSSPWRDRTLSHAMEARRHEWMAVMARRNLRMVDTAILAGLQQGTAFFASTCILAIGGCFAMLGSGESVLRIYHDLPFASPTTQAAWEAKFIGLAMIFAYSFFKFGWSYRLFNYCSIAVGAVPDGDEDSAERALRTRRAADLNVLAGQHFNAGLRGIFLSIGFMGWFAGPAAFVAASALILVILVRRQFFSRARLAAQGAAA
ncbi:MAG: DUF599 family protein [Nitratireductor sp.]|jgi:uncharacterized membrane protein|nr:DUF599 family protein [Nitratireductor sp.]